MQKLKLESLIFTHYARSALLSILTIEILLLIMYFSINAYNGRQTEKTLKAEVEDVMPRLVTQAAESINENFSFITRQTRFFAEAHVPLFATPEAVIVTGEKPVFKKAANGSTYQDNLKDGSSIFISATGKTGPVEMEFAEKSATLNPLYRHVVQDTPNVVAAYINTPGDLNRLYPFMEKVWEQYPPDLNMEDYNFYYLADEKHNPARKPVWTGVYLDPAGQGWMLSCIAPVYRGDTLEGVVGLDVTVEKIVSNVLKMDLPWGASAFLADDKGMILAMSEKIEKLFELQELKSHVYSSAISKEQLKPEEFNLFKIADPSLVQGLKEIYTSQARIAELSTREGPVFLIQAVIPETGWRAFVIVKESEVFESVERLARISQMIGFAAIGGMLAFYLAFFLFLRSRARRMAAAIAEPVETLSRATNEMGTGISEAPIAASGIEELDTLTENFNTMSSQLAERSRELVEARVRTEMKSKEAELSYTRGLYESASGYLHNVGNAITRMESSLMDVQAAIKGAAQFPEVFRTIRAGGEKGEQTLKKFEEVLVGKTVPAISSAATDIARIKDSIKQTIAHQQAGFISQKQIPERFDLSELLERLCADYTPRAAKAGIAIHRAITPETGIVGFREPTLQGFENLIKNAIESSHESGSIRVSCSPIPDGAEVTVTDDGAGIAPENLPKIMSAGFTTKPDGHGFGLHSFAVALSASGGRLSLTSPGPGKGATVRAEIHNAK